MKLCKDCKHYEYKRNWILDNEHLCHGSDRVKINLVDGREQLEKYYIPCEAGRGLLSECGEEGKLWEPK